MPASSVQTAVWPWASSAIRYSTAEAAATGFATDYLHMTSPVVGAFAQGDSRSGEVPVRSTTSGPVTTVLVRQLGPDASWWVLGAGAADISVAAPSWNAVVTSPVTFAGTSVAFEGTVQTQVRQDGVAEPLAKGFVTGGGTQMAPFAGTLAFPAPTAARGAVVLETISAKDGSVVQASVVRIRLG